VYFPINAFSYHDLETTCYYWDYVIAYECFLAKADFIYMLYPKMFMIISFLCNGNLKYSYVFSLMTNVVLRISHKEFIGPILVIMTCYIDGPLFNNFGNAWIIFLN
jgi:hypothetical protein